MRVLVIGGSGFLSGAVARVALGAGAVVEILTRGRRALPAGATPILVDRDDPEAFAHALASVDGDWDVVIDCIGFNAAHARQDLDAFVGRTLHLAFVSTDSVLDPLDRPWRLDETFDRFDARAPYAIGKRAAERVLVDGSRDAMSRCTCVSIHRPCHIYGPGSKLGCLPEHSRDDRLIERIRAGEPLHLVGGGHFLQQPVFADDVARLLLSVPTSDVRPGEIYAVAGPEVMASRDYYRAIAVALGVPMPAIVEVPIVDATPAVRHFCCHRVYDLTKATGAKLKMPATSFAVGIAGHVRSLLTL